MNAYRLKKSSRKDKKYMIITPDNKKIHFGAKGYEDFTTHKDLLRRNMYIIRHKKNEDWTIKGLNTAGFWSRYVLWNKKSIDESIKDIEDLFNIRIINLI